MTQTSSRGARPSRTQAPYAAPPGDLRNKLIQSQQFASLFGLLALSDVEEDAKHNSVGYVRLFGFFWELRHSPNWAFSEGQNILR
jgi:hypothetical protein